MVNIIVNYCCARNMLKEIETEQRIDFFVTFCCWWHFNWGAPCSPLPPATPMVGRWQFEYKTKNVFSLFPGYGNLVNKGVITIEIVLLHNETAARGDRSSLKINLT